MTGHAGRVTAGQSGTRHCCCVVARGGVGVGMGGTLCRACWRRRVIGRGGETPSFALRGVAADNVDA